MRGIDINSVIDPNVVKAATGGCFIAYHRKRDGFQVAVPYWSWPALEKQGEVADGVLVLIDGRAPIIVSPTGFGPVNWSKNEIAVNPDVEEDYSKAYVDYSGKTRIAAIMAKSNELFGSNDDAKNYAPGWCANYSHGGLGVGKWWLPSIAELIEIWKHKDAINECLSVIAGATPLSERGHWSSTESSATCVWSLYLNLGELRSWYNKVSHSNYVRAISTFNDGVTQTQLYFPQDGKTYGVKNGISEIIANAGEDVLTADTVTAQSIALDSLNSGTLQIDADTPPSMVEEVRRILGDEIFNEMATQSAQTMELHPQLSFEEQIENAKAEYRQRKAEQAEQAEMMAKMLEQAEKAEYNELDVEPSKTE